MKEKAFEKATEYIDAMAEKLGVAVEHVYGILVQQKITEGIVYSGFLTLVSIGFIIAFVKIFKAYQNYDGYDDEIYLYSLIPTGIIGAIVVIVSLFVVPNFVLQIFNPEYYAIKEILDTIGGK